MLFQTIQAAAVDTRAQLYSHIVLSGGSSMYPGLPSRLEKEMKQLYLTRVLGGDPSRLNVRLSTSALHLCADLSSRVEIQDSHRGSTSPEAHGLLGRRCARGHHEEPGRILGNARGVVREGPGVTGQARSQHELDVRRR